MLFTKYIHTPSAASDRNLERRNDLNWFYTVFHELEKNSFFLI